MATIRGPVGVEYRKTAAAGLQIDLVIPANMIVEVHLPATDPSLIYEREKPAVKAAGVKFLRMEMNRCIFEVGSGTYEFRILRDR